MSNAATTTRFPLLCSVVLAAAGCASAPEPREAGRGAADRQPAPVAVRQETEQQAAERYSATPASRAAAIALDQVGSPYRYGGTTPAGFDCSGLVHYAYGSVGLRTPRTTGELWSRLPPVSRASLAVGDVLFFDIDGKVSHVGLYLGGGRFVHAPSSGRHVSVARLDDLYYQRAFIRGGRPAP